MAIRARPVGGRSRGPTGRHGRPAAFRAARASALGGSAAAAGLVESLRMVTQLADGGARRVAKGGPCGSPGRLDRYLSRVDDRGPGSLPAVRAVDADRARGPADPCLRAVPLVATRPWVRAPPGRVTGRCCTASPHSRDLQPPVSPQSFLSGTRGTARLRPSDPYGTVTSHPWTGAGAGAGRGRRRMFRHL